MDYSLWIHGKFIPAERVGWPSRFRVGFRGPGPATREAGTVQLKIDDRDGYWQHSSDKIELKQEVWVDRGSQRIFRGAISYKEVDKKRNWIQLQAKETAAILKEHKAGLGMIGIPPNGPGTPNSNLYLWIRQDEIPISGTEETANCLMAIAEGKYQDLTLEEQATYEKAWLFSSYYWMSNAQSIHVKLAWTEPITIGAILDELYLQGLLEEYSSFSIGTIGIDGPTWQGKLRIQDEEDELLEIGRNAGLVRQGVHVFVYWFEEPDYTTTYYWKIKVAQLVNRSRAILLADFEFDRIRAADTEDWDGPRIVANTRDPRLLAFYLQNKQAQQGMRNMQFASISLEDALGREYQGGLKPHFSEQNFAIADGEWLYSTPEAMWDASTTPTPQKRKILHLDDGCFSIYWTPDSSFFPTGGPVNVIYNGNLLLPAIVYDFKDADLGKILSEIAYVNGCDWWVDVQGRLQMRRIDGALTDGVISGQILEEREIEEELFDKEFEYDLSGIPISSTHARLLAEAWAGKRRETGKTKRIEVLVEGEIGAELGQRTEIEGTRYGILEAMEFEKEKVILEMRV